MSPTVVPPKPGKNPLLLLIYFFLGAFTLIQQTIILREIFVVVSGNELSFGITLANWLAGVFFGSAAGGFVVDRIRRVRPAFASVVWLLCLVSPLMIRFRSFRFLPTRR
jgi:predicted MFS family arabinose efflux permease